MRLPFVRAAWLAALLLLAGCATTSPHVAPTPSPLLLISIDGLRADMIGTGALPTVDALAKGGVHAEWMNPSYPTLTFPNHYTLVTGLRPDRHGIVHNNFRDPQLGLFMSKEASAKDGRFWLGEPIWSGAEKAGIPSATMFWPGSESEIAGQRPRYWRKFDRNLSPQQRVQQVLAWLDLPITERPRLITLYMEQFDVAAHATSTFSPESMAALRAIDDALAALLAGLETRGLRERSNVIVLSDHGMSDVRAEDVRYLDDRLDPSLYDVSWWGQITGVTPKAGTTARVEAALLGRHDHYACWRKTEMPAQWKFGNSPRIPPIVCQADVDWRVMLRRHPAQQTVKAEHGFVPEDPQMRAMFVATGPAFHDGTALPAFDNVDVYPLLAHLLGVTPAPNDGRLDTFIPVLEPDAAYKH